MNLTLTNAASTLTGGMKTQEDRVAKAASDIVNAFAATQNALSDASVRPPAEDAAALDAPPALATDRVRAAAPEADAGAGADLDVLRPMVSMLEAEHAYAAAGKALNVVGDIQRDAIDRMGRRARVDA